jgi:arylsulfatase A-like enzyme
VVPPKGAPDAKLTAWPHDLLKNWDKTTDEEKRLFIRQADVYGAYLAYADDEIGRVIQAVEDMGKLDNTLIIFISGDNGASAEGTLNGTFDEFLPFNGVAPTVAENLRFMTLGAATKLTRSIRFRGPGPSTRRTSGPSRFHPSSAAPGRAWRSHGRAISPTRAASATSSIT